MTPTTSTNTSDPLATLRVLLDPEDRELLDRVNNAAREAYARDALYSGKAAKDRIEISRVTHVLNVQEVAIRFMTRVWGSHGRLSAKRNRIVPVAAALSAACVAIDPSIGTS